MPTPFDFNDPGLQSFAFQDTHVRCDVCGVVVPVAVARLKVDVLAEEGPFPGAERRNSYKVCPDCFQQLKERDRQQLSPLLSVVLVLLGLVLLGLFCLSLLHY